MYFNKFYFLLCALFLFSTSLLIAQTTESESELDSLIMSAQIQLQTDKYYQSLKTIELFKSKAASENLNNKVALAENLFYMVYVNMHAYDRAESHILEAIKLNSIEKDTNLLSINYCHIAHFYMLSEDYPNYDRSLKKARIIDKYTNSRHQLYNYETEVMALYKQKKFDSLTIVAGEAIKELQVAKNNQADSLSSRETKYNELVNERFQLTFEFYLAYGLIETNKDLELGNQLLNRVKDKKLEEILWFSPRVYKQYYRINRYKSKYFLAQRTVNLDSIRFYEKKAAIYFDKTTILLEEKTGANISYLNQAIEGDMKIERLELLRGNKEQESLFIKRISYLMACVALLSIAFILYFKSINKRIRKINNVLDVKNTTLKQLHKHRNKFLAVLSHEIRTPMYALQELIANAAVDYGEEEGEEFSLANYSLINLRHSVDNSLQFSRLNYFKDNLSIVEAPIDIKNLVFELRKYYTPILIINDVELITDMELQHKAFEFNRSKIAMVLHNLLKNAIELEDIMSIRFTVKETSISANKSKLKFRVTDDGAGIGKEMLDYVAMGEILITDENTNKGIKLGLILCNQILALYNSKLVFETTENENSVSFELELKPSKRLPKYPQRIAKSTARKKILYVDDNMINLLITKKIIESINHDCHIESSSRNALEKVKTYNYDLILMDINMPEMDGFEASMAIHKINATIPIIAFTALSEDEILNKCKAAKMSEVLTKPLDSNQFKRTLEKYFGRLP